MIPGLLLTPWRCRILIAATIVVAFFPAFLAEINDLDDVRFIVDNPEVKELGASQVWRFFTDPTTVDPGMWKGTYRPLRTLDFAIDWAISGERPFFYHFRNVLYHVLAAWLAFGLFRRLGGARAGATRLDGMRGPSNPEAAPARTRGLAAPLAGALVFALHPVQTESVAWITSRGDLLLTCFFLLALNLHLDGRRGLAALALLGALLSKEAAVVFPAAALLADLVRRDGPRQRSGGPHRPGPFRWYAVYGLMAVGFYVGWRLVMPEAGHSAQWWGGSYLANLQVMARGLLYYARILVLPVQIVFDYRIPGVPAVGAGTILALALLAALALAAWRAGVRVRFALAWFFVMILPTSNLFFTVGIPTAERFLYLPIVGLAFLAGVILVRARLWWLPLVCLAILTFDRTRDWKSEDTLLTASERVTETPLAIVHRADLELKAAHEAYREWRAGDPEARERMTRSALRTVDLCDRLFSFYEERLRVEPTSYGGLVLAKKASALLLLERYEEARSAARESAGRWGGGPNAHYNAGAAAEKLAIRWRTGAERSGLPLESLDRAAGYFEEAAFALDDAVKDGYTRQDLRTSIIQNLLWGAEDRRRAAEAETVPERQGDQHERAGRDRLLAANVLITFGEQGVRDAMKHYVEAGEDLEASLDRTPLDDTGRLLERHRLAGEAFFSAGTLHQQVDRLGEARDLFHQSAIHFEQALALLPPDPSRPENRELARYAATALLRKALFLEFEGNVEEMLRLVLRAQALFPSPEAAAILRRHGR